MSDKEFIPAHEDPELTGFIIRAIRFGEGSMSPSELADFDLELQTDQRKLQLFAELQIQGTSVRYALRQQAYQIELEDANVQPTPSVATALLRWTSLTIAACLCLLLAGYFLGRAQRQTPVLANRDAGTIEPIMSKISASLANSSQAKLFGDLLPTIGSPLLTAHDYVLTEGMVEIDFASGVRAIVESPAVFQIVNEMGVSLDAGRCSVIVPKGAEGFAVVTPTTRVVDKGTRFAVDVSEALGTKVSVVQGAAELFTPERNHESIRLEQGVARRVNSDSNYTVSVADFDANEYRSHLRIESFVTMGL